MTVKTKPAEYTHRLITNSERVAQLLFRHGTTRTIFKSTDRLKNSSYSGSTWFFSKWERRTKSPCSLRLLKEKKAETTQSFPTSEIAYPHHLSHRQLMQQLIRRACLQTAFQMRANNCAEYWHGSFYGHRRQRMLDSTQVNFLICRWLSCNLAQGVNSAFTNI